MNKEEAINPDLHEFLTSKGFTTASHYIHRDPYMREQEYFLSLGQDVPFCQCNEKPPNLCTKVYTTSLTHNTYTAVSINIRAEAGASETWSHVGAYSILPEEFKENYDKIVKATTECWKTFYKVMTEEE